MVVTETTGKCPECGNPIVQVSGVEVIGGLNWYCVGPTGIQRLGYPIENGARQQFQHIKQPEVEPDELWRWWLRSVWREKS